MLDTLFKGATVVDGSGARTDHRRRRRPGRPHRRGRPHHVGGQGEDRRRRRLADARLRRHPHPLRRPGDLGRDLQPEHPPRRDDAGDGQLRRRLRAARARARGRPDRADGRRGGHPRRRADRGHPLALGELPAVHGRAGRDAAQPGLPGAGAARPAAHGRDGRPCAWRSRPPPPTTSPQMRALLAEALDAGATGFSTGRTDNHRTAAGHETPSSEADAEELAGIVAAFHGRDHGVVQLVSDFDLMRAPERFDPEFDLVETLAPASRPAAVDDLAAARPGRRRSGRRSRRASKPRSRAACRCTCRPPRAASASSPGWTRASTPSWASRATRRWPSCRWPSAPRRCATRRARRASWPSRASAWPATARRSRRWWTSCWRRSSASAAACSRSTPSRTTSPT